MKIVNVCFMLNEGFGYHENIFPYYQKKVGLEPYIITSIMQDLKKIKVKEGKYEEKGIPVIRLKYSWKQGQRFIKLKGLTEVLLRIKPDIIYIHSIIPINLYEIVKYKKKYDCKLIIDNHADLDNSARNILWRIGFYNIFLRGVYKIFDKYINKYYGVTPYRMDFLINEIGIKKEKIGFLPQGYDNEEVEEVKKEVDFFKKNYNLEINETDIKIVFGGKIDSWKCFDNIILALENLKNKKIKLMIFGVINCPKIKRLIEENSEWIFFLGWKKGEEKYKILKNSDIAIWPKYHTTLIEDCIGAELPLIIFKNRNSEYFLEEGNGIFLKDESIESIVEAVQKIINDNNLEYYKVRASFTKEKLSYENISREFLKELKKL